ncbi:MAG: secondary thiamine-phosphate synthase enzyme YjbQ [Gammaproteobacteria bacterium]|nr:secondary thiamine-phosphate synthase enzyme YjbQ [Gammaproteobacteria bacterium]
MIHQQSFTVRTRRRGTYDITDRVRAIIAESGITTGICQLFIHHTSASLTLCENADPSVREDLEHFMARLVPDGDPRYRHADEGPDDMAAHIRSILTKMDLSLPVTAGRAGLGTWQGIYLWEHRSQAHDRRVSVTLCGD